MRKRGKTVNDNDLNTSGGRWGHFFGGVTVGTLGTLALAVAAAAVENRKEKEHKEKIQETHNPYYIPPNSNLPVYPYGSSNNF